MNFNGFDFDSATVNMLNKYDGRNLPHALIAESSNKQKAMEVIRFLSMYVECTSSEDKPCGVCKGCIRASKKAHADVSYPKPDKKSKSNKYSIEQIRSAIIPEIYKKPNDGVAKMCIFEDADIKCSETVLNALLKVIEEPPENVYFIFQCESAERLIDTVRSRCALLKINEEKPIPQNIREAAEKIVSGILSPREYDLMLALKSLEDKDASREILSCVSLALRDGVAVLSGGKPLFNSELAKKLAARCTRKSILEMIELTEEAKVKCAQFVYIKLLTTALCGDYRRISWQR